jgi:hypothetical protein
VTQFPLRRVVAAPRHRVSCRNHRGALSSRQASHIGLIETIVMESPRNEENAAEIALNHSAAFCNEHARGAGDR